MAGENLGSAYAEIRIETNKIKKDVANTKKQFSSLKTGLGKSLAGIATAIGTAFALDKAKDFAKASVSAFSEFESGIRKVSTIADTTQKSTKQLEKDAKSLARRYTESTGQITEGMYQMISATGETVGVTEKLDVAIKSAKGGFTTTTKAVDGLTSVTNAYGKTSTKAMEDIANQMLVAQNLGKTTFGEMANSIGRVAPVAKSAGISTKELFASISTLTKNGVKTTETMTSLKAIMSNIAKPTSDAAGLADSLGIKFDVVSIKSMGWAKWLKQVKKGLEDSNPTYVKTVQNVANYKRELNKLKTSYDNGKISKQEFDSQSKELKYSLQQEEKQMKILTEAGDGQVAKMAQLFGSVEALNSMLVLTSDTGTADMNKALKEMETNTTALQKASDTMMSSLKETLKGVTTELELMMINIGKAIANADWFKGMVKKVLETFKGISTVIETQGFNIASILDVIMSSIGSTVAGAMRTIAESMGIDLNPFIKTFKSLYKQVKTTLKQVLELASNLLETLAPAFNMIAVTVLPALVKALELALQGINGLLDVINYLIDAFNNAPAPIKKVIEVLTGTAGVYIAITTVTGAISTLAITTIPALIGTIAKLSTSLIALNFNPVVLAISLVVAAIGTLILNWDKVKEVAKKTVEAISGFWKKLTGQVETATKENTKYVKESNEKMKADTEKTLAEIRKNNREQWAKIGQSIKDKMGEAKESIGKIWNNVKETFVKTNKSIKKDMQLMAKDLSDKTKKLKEELIKTWSNIQTKIVKKTLEMTNSVKTKYGELKEKMGNIWTDVKATTTEKLSSMVTATKNKMKTMRQTVGRMFDGSEWKTYLINSLKGLAKLIASPFDSVIKAIKSSFEGLIDFIKGVIDYAKSAYDNVKETMSSMKDSVSDFASDVVESGKSVVNQVVKNVSTTVNNYNNQYNPIEQKRTLESSYD